MLSEALIGEIRGLHAGPDRGYHGWSHPLALLRLHAEVEDQLRDSLAVRCAILLHDAIYEPRRRDNESRSAALAAEMLKGVVPEPMLARTLRLIEATAHHAIPADLPADEVADMAMFLDMGLSILGAAPEIFDAYEAGVRHEYREVPEDAFRAGRVAILKGFLAREALYFSDWGRDRFEPAARENLKRSIASLQMRGER
jgi:predicted metal-dependent HD superfamily phosphohydrolase